MSASLLITEARSWLGTPWIPNSQIKKAGVDCVNFLTACANAVGFEINLPSYYEQLPAYDKITPFLLKVCHLTDSLVLFPEAIVVFQYRGIAHHVAIATDDNTIIHASIARKKVVEETLTTQQKNKILAIYCLDYAKKNTHISRS